MLRTDLTPAQLAAAPILTDVDLLLIDDLTEAEDDAFAASHRGCVGSAANPGDEDFGAAGQVHELRGWGDSEFIEE